MRRGLELGLGQSPRLVVIVRGKGERDGGEGEGFG